MMPQINLEVLQKTLQSLPSEEIVSAESVCPYLFNHVIRPIQQGQIVHYGDLDYDQFDDLDLLRADDYFDALAEKERHLDELSDQMRDIDACAIKRRAFC